MCHVCVHYVGHMCCLSYVYCIYVLCVVCIPCLHCVLCVVCVCCGVCVSVFVRMRDFFFSINSPKLMGLEMGFQI